MASGKSLTVFEAGLALLSTIIGGGIVGIPFAILQLGIPFGIVIILIIAAMSLYSGSLYLRVKDLSPTKVESLYELGFVTMGSASIYFIAATMMSLSLGACIIYFVIFGDIAASLAK